MNIRTITQAYLPEIQEALHPTMFWDLGFYINIQPVYCESGVKFCSTIIYHLIEYDIYVIEWDNKLAVCDDDDLAFFEFETYEEALKTSAQIIEYYKNDLHLIGIMV